MDEGQLSVDRYCKDDTEANLNKVISQFTPLVKKMAISASTLPLRYNKILEIEDLENSGYLGLLKALKGYKEKKEAGEVGNKFITYAFVKVKYQILDDIRKHEIPGKRLIRKEDKGKFKNQSLNVDVTRSHASYTQEKNWNDLISLEQLLNTLSHKNKDILLLLFFEDYHQSEVAVKYGIKQPSVQWLKEKSLKKLKNYGF
jgi:RNA polymerase sigma factor (sigma-70 family)